MHDAIATTDSPLGREVQESGMAPRIAILGAGLAGLSAARGLVARGYDVNIFERDHLVGGLAKSISQQGFTFDIGPHRLLAPPGSRVLQLVQELLGDDLQVCQRQSRIFKAANISTIRSKPRACLPVRRYTTILLPWEVLCTVASGGIGKRRPIGISRVGLSIALGRFCMRPISATIRPSCGAPPN